MSKDNDKETNINVIVRVRPRNSKEIAENSPSVASAQNGKEVLLKVGPGSSSMSTKTYHFDKVFGPESTQKNVFDQVVSPILEEVLMGYNCTIFAYGQTGTGKTYTMEGNLTDPNHPDAGVIPRTLFALFDALDGECAEYTVRVSFVELYNEELKDLLSPEDDFRKLRIYDDLSRKGSVVIQGLEEIMVKNAQDVISILQKGSHKRQIAATKMNEVSSRSHSIFSITVHTKESTPDGEELLKIGKLNLVDLAGSENIARSGAEKMRAKEAGMINQSLLTLGRVIDALVGRSPHIPYRESKLTRLLQDSLGGRTKTCIIAAVSPAKCNLEESQSTLDYASRAKNIRNKPEVNQKMTKKALIREYAFEIERLQNDLQAARDKNGIYLSQETYQSIVGESQGRKERIEELLKNIEHRQEMIRHLETKFEQNTELLKTTNESLTAALNEIDEKKNELNETLQQLETTRDSLQNQIIITSAYAETEKRMDALASGLVSTLKSSVQDIHGLHSKLERKSALEIQNTRVFSEFQEDLQSHVHTIETQVDNMRNSTSEFLDSLASKFGLCSSQLSKDWADALAQHDAGLHHLLGHSEQIKAQLDTGNQALQSDLSQLEDLIKAIRIEAHDRARASVEGNVRVFESMRQAFGQHQTEMLVWSQQFGSELRAAFSTMEGYINQRKVAESQREAQVQQVLRAEITALQEQNRLLREQLAQEREAVPLATQTLLSDITQLVTAFSSRREQAFTETATRQCDAAQERIDRLEGLFSTAAAFADDSVKTHDAALVELGTRSTDAEKTLALGSNLVDEKMRSFVDGTHGVQQTLQAHTEATVDTVEQGTTKLAATVEAAQLARQQRHEAAAETATVAEQDTQSILNDMKTRSSQLGEATLAHLSAWAQETEEFTGSASEDLFDQIDSTIDQMQQKIACQVIAIDTPTGKTPRKRPIRFPVQWSLTRSPSTLIKEYRANASAHAATMAPEGSEHDGGMIGEPCPSPAPSPLPTPTSIRQRTSGYEGIGNEPSDTRMFDAVMETPGAASSRQVSMTPMASKLPTRRQPSVRFSAADDQ